MRGNYLKARAILPVIALIAVIALAGFLASNSGVIFPSTKAKTSDEAPTSTTASNTTPPAPLTLGDIVLNPANQTVSMYGGDLYQTNFNITFSLNPNSPVPFPCYIGIISSQPPNGKGTSLNFEPTGYGTYSFSLYGTSSLQHKTIAYYALIKDSNGALILSNTVTVKYI